MFDIALLRGSQTLTWLAGIGTVFLLALFFLELPLLMRSLQIKAVTRKCRKGVMSLAVTETQTRRNLILRSLSTRRWLRPVAEAFDKKWRAALRVSSDAAIGDIDFLAHVSPEAVLPRISNRDMAHAMPGILVALGILGTFMGLVKGLPAVGSQEISGATDPAQLSRLVNTITQSLGLAFWTSIVGISGSVLFLFIDRILFQTLEGGIKKLSAIVGEVFPTVSEQELGRIQLGLLEEASQDLKTMGTDMASALADAIAPAFDKAMTDHMAPAMNAIQESVEKLVKFSSEEQVQGMKSLVDGFIGSMNTALGSQFQEFQGILSSTVESHRELGTGLELFSSRLKQSSEVQLQLVGETTRAAETLGSTLGRLETISQSLADAAGKVADAGILLNNSAEAATKAQEAALAAQSELLAAARGHSEAMSEAREQLSQAWDRAIAQATGAINQIQEATRELGEGIGDQLVKALQTFDGALAEVVQRFSGTLAQVDGSVGELPPAAEAIKLACDGLKAQTEAMSETVARIENLVTGIVADNVDRATEAARQLSEGTARATEAAVALNLVPGQLRQLLEEMTQASAGFSRASDTMERMEGSLQEIGRTSSPIQSHLSGILSAMDGGKPVSSLQETIKRLSADIEQLQASIERMLTAPGSEKARSRWSIFGGKS